ncbi:ATP-binding protein [Anaeroselena agilis]|uniref:ATP-binding protein n=1 Tax=Anaeroselena agilis TaxID=3063788 RepID=A0ABU3P501_9FIRM|nr:ATP-binding protein [Selenomonadales bacterium 4137-cl]
MGNIDIIGKVSATERNPNSCDEFNFWLKDDIILGPFDIVKVPNKMDGSTTFGVVQDIFHITDSPGHISNFVSSDFGDVEAKPMTSRLALSYAKASVVHNDKENYMPVLEGTPVYTCSADDIRVALGLNDIKKESAISAGILKTSNGVVVPIDYNGDFLIGPEGAHLNVSGISGLATKTSYIMFLLKAIQEKLGDEVAIIVMNVKGDDLLHLDEKNTKITEEQIYDWNTLSVPCEPFKNVTYYYPFAHVRGTDVYSNTSLSKEDLLEQYEAGRAFNYIYTFDHDIKKIDMLFSNVDDPNFTIESILNFIETSREFGGEMSWSDFKQTVRDYTNKVKSNQDILVQSWRKFSRLINNSIDNSIFVNSKSSDKKQRHCHLSDAVKNINGGDMMVIDIASLDEQMQCLVFGDTIRAVYDLKHGDYDDIERKSKKPVPKKIVVFVDELNKYAPSTSPKGSPLLANLLDITERGRQEGIILFSAEQFKSSIHDRVKGNCGTNIYGRTNAIEVSKPDYRYIPNVYANMMTRLGKGDLIIQHPVFKTLLKVKFPYPCYHQGGTKK